MKVAASGLSWCAVLPRCWRMAPSRRLWGSFGRCCRESVCFLICSLLCYPWEALSHHHQTVEQLRGSGHRSSTCLEIFCPPTKVVLFYSFALLYGCFPKGVFLLRLFLFALFIRECVPAGELLPEKGAPRTFSFLPPPILLLKGANAILHSNTPALSSLLPNLEPSPPTSEVI